MRVATSYFILRALTRNVALLTSVALIAALTLTPMGGDGKVEVSELNDVTEAFRQSDAPFLLDFSLEAIANVLLFVPFGAALRMRGYSIAKTAGYGLLLAATVEGAQWLLIPAVAVAVHARGLDGSRS